MIRANSIRNIEWSEEYQLIIFLIDYINKFFTTMLPTHLYVRVHILLTCGRHLHDRIIRLTEESWAHKTSVISRTVIEMHVPSQESEQSC